MNIKEMQDEIMRIKKEKDICILAHAYQSHDIWEVADYVGDSFGLAQRAASSDWMAAPFNTVNSVMVCSSLLQCGGKGGQGRQAVL